MDEYERNYRYCGTHEGDEIIETDHGGYHAKCYENLYGEIE